MLRNSNVSLYISGEWVWMCTKDREKLCGHGIFYSKWFLKVCFLYYLTECYKNFHKQSRNFCQDCNYILDSYLPLANFEPDSEILYLWVLFPCFLEHLPSRKHRLLLLEMMTNWHSKISLIFFFKTWKKPNHWCPLDFSYYSNLSRKLSSDLVNILEVIS